MPRTGQNVRKRKDGRWEGRVKQVDVSYGVTKYVSVYGKTYKEVKEKMILLQSQKAQIVRKDKKVSFSSILYLWLENNNIRQKESTKLKYRFMIEKHIIPELGEIDITNLNETIINGFLNRKLNEGRLDGAGGLSPAYVKNIALVIQSAVRFAVEHDYCKPFKSSIYKPSEIKKDLPILEKEDQLKFEKFLENNLSLTALGILISLNTGLRIGEICALKWEQVDLKNRLIFVRYTIARVKNTNPNHMAETCLVLDKPKTRTSVREIPISSKLLPILQKMKEVSSSEYVISDKSTFVSPRTFEYRYHRQLELCGIPSINFHALRHTFATRCIETGVDVKSLSEFLGHANVSITLNTYVHSSMDLKRQQIEKLVSASC